MVGFVNAVAILIILGQLGDFTGYDAAGSNKVAQTIDLLLNLDQILLPTLMIGIVTIILIVTLEETSLGALGMVVAIIVSSLLVQLAGWEEVALVTDIADIPESLPRPVLPPLSVIPALILPAFSLAFVGLVQGAGVSRNYVNPDGQYPDASGDFVGQGVANVVAGLFQGMPVGGSVSATGLVTSAGAKTRLANIFAAIIIGVVILLFAGAVGYIALPAIAGLLIVVGFRTLKPDQIEMVFKTGRVQQVVMIITFVACLFIPLQYAVMIGVALAVILFVVEQSNRVEVKAWEWEPGDLPIEHDAPEEVPSNEVTVVVAYGNIFFATASLIEEKLPAVTPDTHHAVIILTLRSEEDLGSTFLEALGRYATDLRDHDSRLMLAEVSSMVKDQLYQTKIAHVIGGENIYVRTEKFGETVTEAWHHGHSWLAEQPERSLEAPAETTDDTE
jgi:SulP family sulfate permease